MPLENKKDFLRVGAVPQKLYAVYVGDRQLGFRYVYRQQHLRNIGYVVAMATGFVLTPFKLCERLDSQDAL